MDLTDEEKIAIERLEDIFYNDLGKGINKFEKITLYGNDIEKIILLLVLLEKQQKEIERYKRIADMNLKDSEEFKNEMCNHRCILKSDLEENYIPKEAIRELLNREEETLKMKRHVYEIAPEIDENNIKLKKIIGEEIMFHKCKINAYEELLGE